MKTNRGSLVFGDIRFGFIANIQLGTLWIGKGLMSESAYIFFFFGELWWEDLIQAQMSQSEAKNKLVREKHQTAQRR